MGRSSGKWKRLEILLRGDYRKKSSTKFERTESRAQLKRSDPGPVAASILTVQGQEFLLDIRKVKQVPFDGFSFHCE